MNDTRLREGEKALDELKRLYHSGVSSWPVEWRGQKLSESEFKQQVEKIFKGVEGERKRSEVLDAALAKSKGMSESAAQTRSKLENQLVELSLQRDILKVEQINEKLATQLQNLGSALQNTTFLAANLTTDKVRSIDELISQEQAYGSDGSVFRKALGLE